MKKLLMFCLILGFQKTIMAQCDIAQKLVSMTPTSINIGQTADLKFTISNDGTGVCSYPVGAVKVVLSIPSIAYNFQEIVAPAAGVGAYFTWTYNAAKKVVIGINHTAIPVGSAENNVIVRVVGATAAKAASNININIEDGSANLSTSNDPSVSSLTVLASPLPVRLISFDGKATIKGNELTWKTSAEQNFSHYEVEKSGNAKQFNFIGKVAGAKNSKENLSYSYLDQSIAGISNTAYYRLKMVDLDGSVNYSKTIFIEDKAVKSTLSEFYPNPVIGNEVSIIINSTVNNQWTITSFDLSGLVLNTENRILNVGENKVTVKLQKDHSGVSVFRFQNAEGVFNRKVYKQ